MESFNHSPLMKVLASAYQSNISGGGSPSNDDMLAFAKAAYDSNPPQEISGYKLVESTPTLKFYLYGRDIVVGVRGTQDGEDIKADGLIGVGRLEHSARFLSDIATLERFQEKYPISQYTYYGAGHSLGGAIIDLFLSRGLIQSGRSYNPAIQNENRDTNNQRVYNDSDALYKIMGKKDSKAEVRTPQKSFWKQLVSKLPFVGKIYNTYDSHKLDSFTGGKL